MVVPGSGRVNDDGLPGRSGSEWVVLGLGSNLGDRAAHLSAAREGLRGGGFAWTLASDVIETEPVGGPPGQALYLNQVIAAPRDAVRLSPRELLRLCQAVESRAGRERGAHWGPRTLDVDVLLFGSMIVDEPDLAIPHPLLEQRAFVLGPLAQILPGLRHPRSGLTVEESARRLPRGAAPP